MDRCPKDEPTDKNLVWKKALPISEKNWKNLLGGGGEVASTPPLSHRRVNRQDRTKELVCLVVAKHMPKFKD